MLTVAPLAVCQMNTHTFKAENDRLATVIHQYEAQQFNLLRQAAEAEAAHNKLHVEWVSQQQKLEQTRKASEKLRSELMAARGEKQLLERSLGEVKSKAARTAEKRKEDGRNVQSHAVSLDVPLAALCRLDADSSLSADDRCVDDGRFAKGRHRSALRADRDALGKGGRA
jgi:vacuolar-type H+-ATPase subunit I/STV1